ncbi:aldolase/citrate lyase family protein [Paracoccus sp. CPCC 101403]|uniref:Aldolase/citrate lyase family protein n=1 Tax=Paracoccus broussonetiae TaxID=3075834 RepID=A0ABU3EIY1_9RHOB|nr:aldolase/citrate lyase family protein [Paracoccus sp. CPCC 101403]MDT1064213.1 aldolase/citrate lyase family protein [Paracoccus sp. CPCC 101403]
MDKIGRLNGIIAALEEGRKPTMAFARAEREEAIQLGLSQLDGVLFEMEHTPYSPSELRDALQFMLNRRRMIDGASLRPDVTPFVRIPANGAEMNTWMAKQVLDQGVYGVVFPHIATAEQARNAVAACRYARPKDAPNYEPKGLRGDAPNTAARYWGLSVPEYYARADVWPLVPEGEIMVIVMIESVEAVENLAEILAVPGIGAIMIGEGDLSQQLGYPRQYEHPVVAEAKRGILAAAKAAGMRVAHPHVTSGNVAEVITEGYDILFAGPSRSYATLEKAKSLM